MKEFTMSMFANKTDLLEAKCKYYEELLEEHKKVFEWVKRNKGCNHPNNIEYEIIKLLENLED